MNCLNLWTWWLFWLKPLLFGHSCLNYHQCTYHFLRVRWASATTRFPLPKKAFGALLAGQVIHPSPSSLSLPPGGCWKNTWTFHPNFLNWKTKKSIRDLVRKENWCSSDHPCKEEECPWGRLGLSMELPSRLCNPTTTHSPMYASQSHLFISLFKSCVL